MIQLDSHIYGKVVIAPWNIVKYNVLSKAGPELYGTEPVSYYLINGFLNFNFAFLAGLVALPVILLDKLTTKGKHASSAPSHPPTWLLLLGMYLWILIFFTQPHKVRDE
jgi:alpha-1,2-mannosyltransferase